MNTGKLLVAVAACMALSAWADDFASYSVTRAIENGSEASESGYYRATLRLADGKTFTVVAKGFSKENKYVKSVSLNGRLITDWKLRHADIVKGGELVFEMASLKTPKALD